MSEAVGEDQPKQVVRIHLSADPKVTENGSQEVSPHQVVVSPKPSENGRNSLVAQNGVLPGFHPRTSLTLREQKQRLADEELRAKSKATAKSDLSITYKDVSVIVQVPEQARGFETMASPFINTAKFIATLGKSARKKDFYRLHTVSGIVRPGTMTLVLAPPGHGKSTFLKTICGRLKHQGGDLYFNGRTSQQVCILSFPFFFLDCIQFNDSRI